MPQYCDYQIDLNIKVAQFSIVLRGNQNVANITCTCVSECKTQLPYHKQTSIAKPKLHRTFTSAYVQQN